MALTAPRATKTLSDYPIPERYGGPVKASVKCWQGGLAVLNAGYLCPGTAATGLIAVGIFEETVDNTSGNDGDKSANVRQGVHKFRNSANADLIAQDDVGKLAYIVDDQTVALTSATSTRSIAGTIARVESDGVFVAMGIVPGVDGTDLAAEIVSREAITTDLASTANAKGASLIGIEDSAGIITATTVEGALAEKIDARRIATGADDNVLGNVPIDYVIAIADGVTADKDVVITRKSEVIGVTVIKTAAAGGASDTITVKNSGTAITDAIDINIADKAIARAGTIDDAQSVISAGGTLRVTKTKASAENVACKVIVHTVLRA